MNHKPTEPTAIPSTELFTMFYSYDPEDGIEYHDTEEEARNRAEQAKEFIEFYAADSDGVWPEKADEVSWGRVMGKARVEDRDLTEEEKAENPEWVRLREYTLEKVNVKTEAPSQ